MKPKALLLERDSRLKNNKLDDLIEKLSMEFLCSRYKNPYQAFFETDTLLIKVNFGSVHKSDAITALKKALKNG